MLRMQLMPSWKNMSLLRPFRRPFSERSKDPTSGGPVGKVIGIHHRLSSLSGHPYTEAVGSVEEYGRRGRKVLLFISRFASEGIAQSLHAEAVLDDPTFCLEWAISKELYHDLSPDMHGVAFVRCFDGFAQLPYPFAHPAIIGPNREPSMQNFPALPLRARGNGCDSMARRYPKRLLLSQDRGSRHAFSYGENEMKEQQNLTPGRHLSWARADTTISSMRPTLKSQVRRIRAEIQAQGASTVNGEQLRLLCPDVSVSGQWNEIAKISMVEGWSFTFFPNGSIRLANL